MAHYQLGSVPAGPEPTDLTALITGLAFIAFQAVRRSIISAVTALIAGLAFITVQPWWLRWSDALFEFLDF